MILVTDPNKPLPRAGKGTVVRAQAIKLYSKEINDLCAPHLSAPELRVDWLSSYETVSESVETRGITPPASWSAGEIEPWLMRLCASIHDGVDISPVQDMFDQGFDRSVHVKGGLSDIADDVSSPSPRAIRSLFPSKAYTSPSYETTLSALFDPAPTSTYKRGHCISHRTSCTITQPCARSQLPSQTQPWSIRKKGGEIPWTKFEQCSAHTRTISHDRPTTTAALFQRVLPCFSPALPATLALIFSQCFCKSRKYERSTP